MMIRAKFALAGALVMLGGALVSCDRKVAAGSADAGTSASAAPAPAAAKPAPAPAPTDVRPHGDPEVERACADICEASAQLKCAHASDCMVNCLAMGTVTPCTSEMMAFYHCLLKQPIKNWECDDDGVAAIRQGFCDKEQEKAVLCMDKKVKP
jgi:hypothetical protein